MCVGYKADWYPVLYLCVFWVREDWGKVEECRDSWEDGGKLETFTFQDENDYEVEARLKSFFAYSHPGKLHYNSFSLKKISTVVFTEGA